MSQLRVPTPVIVKQQGYPSEWVGDAPFVVTSTEASSTCEYVVLSMFFREFKDWANRTPQIYQISKQIHNLWFFRQGVSLPANVHLCFLSALTALIRV